MRKYNLAYLVLTTDYEQSLVSTLLYRKLFEANEILEAEKKALTDDDYDKLIEKEVNNGKI